VALAHRCGVSGGLCAGPPGRQWSPAAEDRDAGGAGCLRWGCAAARGPPACSAGRGSARRCRSRPSGCARRIRRTTAAESRTASTAYGFRTRRRPLLRRAAAQGAAWPPVSVSVSLIHPRPAPFTSGRPGRVRAGRGRWRTPVNAGQHCWKACWGQPLRSSNLLSSATLTCDDALGLCSRAAHIAQRVSHFLSQFESWPYALFRTNRCGGTLRGHTLYLVRDVAGVSERNGARRRSVRPTVHDRPGPSARVQVAVACGWIPANSQTASHSVIEKL
jgi:hypothetical protein